VAVVYVPPKESQRYFALTRSAWLRAAEVRRSGQKEGLFVRKYPNGWEQFPVSRTGGAPSALPTIVRTDQARVNDGIVANTGQLFVTNPSS